MYVWYVWGMCGIWVYACGGVFDLYIVYIIYVYGMLYTLYMVCVIYVFVMEVCFVYTISLVCLE